MRTFRLVGETAQLINWCPKAPLAIGDYPIRRLRLFHEVQPFVWLHHTGTTPTVVTAYPDPFAATAAASLDPFAATAAASGQDPFAATATASLDPFAATSRLKGS